MNKKKTILSSAIVLYFIIGLEILIMISPFAGFFYSVFNPFLLGISKYPSTRWLSAFFLPHMVGPARWIFEIYPRDGLGPFCRRHGAFLYLRGTDIRKQVF